MLSGGCGYSGNCHEAVVFVLYSPLGGGRGTFDKEKVGM